MVHFGKTFFLMLLKRSRSVPTAPSARTDDIRGAGEEFGGLADLEEEFGMGVPGEVTVTATPQKLPRRQAW